LKRIPVALLMLAALMLPVSSAGAASPQAKQIKTLQKQVKVLQAQVKTLQARESLTRSVALTSWTATVCTLAMVADTFQSTWKALDDAGITGAPFATLLTPLDDYGACTDLKLTRQTQLSLPSWTAYNSLIAFLYSPS